MKAEEYSPQFENETAGTPVARRWSLSNILITIVAVFAIVGSVALISDSTSMNKIVSGGLKSSQPEKFDYIVPTTTTDSVTDSTETDDYEYLPYYEDEEEDKADKKSKHPTGISGPPKKTLHPTGRRIRKRSKTPSLSPVGSVDSIPTLQPIEFSTDDQVIVVHHDSDPTKTADKGDKKN